jgi:hypothetical protein
MCIMLVIILKPVNVMQFFMNFIDSITEVFLSDGYTGKEDNRFICDLY